MQSVFRTNKNLPKLCYSRPAQSIAQKWIRETKNLHIEISYMYENYWTYDILTIPRHDLIGLSDRPIIRYNTYEEALEAGLQEALNLYDYENNYIYNHMYYRPIMGRRSNNYI